MAFLDVFNSDPFTTIQLTLAVERAPYLPQGLAALNIFEPKPIRTKVAMVEQRQGVLVALPFTDRGAPGTQRTTELRQARHFLLPRIRMEDTIYADELATIREMGSETELMTVQRSAREDGRPDRIAIEHRIHSRISSAGRSAGAAAQQ